LTGLGERTDASCDMNRDSFKLVTTANAFPGLYAYTHFEPQRLNRMNDTSAKSKLISIKIPHSLLESFRRKCELKDVRYQTQIKILMVRWLGRA